MCGALWGLAHYAQVRHFNRAIYRLRGRRTAVGMYGAHYRRRCYAMLAVDEHGYIQRAALFAGGGWWARFRIDEALRGVALADIERVIIDYPLYAKNAYLNAMYIARGVDDGVVEGADNKWEAPRHGRDALADMRGFLVAPHADWELARMIDDDRSGGR